MFRKTHTPSHLLLFLPPSLPIRSDPTRPNPSPLVGLTGLVLSPPLPPPKTKQVFPNDFPALLPTAPPPPPSSDSPSSSTSSSSFFTPIPVSGSSHVLCFSPRHDLTLALMAHDEVTLVVRAWKRIWEASNETYVQIFENRGSMMVSFLF